MLAAVNNLIRVRVNDKASLCLINRSLWLTIPGPNFLIFIFVTILLVVGVLNQHEEYVEAVNYGEADCHRHIDHLSYLNSVHKHQLSNEQEHSVPTKEPLIQSDIFR